MDEPIIIHPQLSPEGRVIAVSDIHGNLPFFSALMDKIALSPRDSLILVGDMIEKGRELWVLNAYLRQGPNGLWCEDSTDYRLPVAPGDRLTVVWQTKDGFLCKKDGVTGWYFGRMGQIQ